MKLSVIWVSLTALFFYAILPTILRLLNTALIIKLCLIKVDAFEKICQKNIIEK